MNRTNEDKCGPAIVEPLIFDRGSGGRRGVSLLESDVPEREISQLIPPHLARTVPLRLPDLCEPEIVRHYTRLERMNMCVDTHFYPLGSCTMKYNPKVNELVASIDNFVMLHPAVCDADAQGILQLMYELEKMLCEITGMAGATLQPAAGAHGELTSMLMIRAYHEDRGEKRTKVLLPDSAHGTNPASTALCGYQVVEIGSDDRGLVDVTELKENLGPDVAALMITNPNTLGLFEEDILEIIQMAHDAGALVHCDGANLNAIMGIARPGDMGFDTIQLNLHKTFSTPHGGGGPGSGPTAVSEKLVPYLPMPVIKKGPDGYRLDYDRPRSIGKVRAFFGNVGVMIKAYAYILTMGSEGLKRVAESSVLHANYLLRKLAGRYHLPYGNGRCMHEFVLSSGFQEEHGITTIDIAKRLIDLGFHPPTINFPLIVKGALMIEPTETETKETLDRFAEAMLKIAEEAEEDPDKLKRSPKMAHIDRPDEVMAARKPDLRWRG